MRCVTGADPGIGQLGHDGAHGDHQVLVGQHGTLGETSRAWG